MKLKYRVIEQFRGKYSIEAMCHSFEVSRSGYYAWRNRQAKEAKDQWLTDLITNCQQRCKQTYGCRRVRRWIERHAGKRVNLKAVLRIMRKYDLLSQIRRRRPYVHYKQAVHKYPNLLQRTFEQPLPNRFWVTDITYIPTAKGMLYLCAVVGKTASLRSKFGARSPKFKLFYNRAFISLSILRGTVQAAGSLLLVFYVRLKKLRLLYLCSQFI